jgi:hypothetical protein
LFGKPPVFCGFDRVEIPLLAKGRAGDEQAKRHRSCLNQPQFGVFICHVAMSKRRVVVAATAISLHEGQKPEKDNETCIIEVGP